MITIDPDTGEETPAIMRNVARAYGGNAGVYCAVLIEGIVHPGSETFHAAGEGNFCGLSRVCCCYRFPHFMTRKQPVAKQRKKQPKLHHDAVTPFRDKLWDLFKEQAKGMDGAHVVLALKQAGEEIWAVGIDDTYSSMKHQDDERLGNAFDITWLTVVCIKLKEIKAGNKPRVRAKG